ncbi:MAG: universal stress protein [Bacteroidota bacterium]
MTPFHTIVAATDLSPASAPALRQAAALAARTGADVHVFYSEVAFREASGSGVGRVRVEAFVAETLGLSRTEVDRLAPTVAVVRDVSAPDAIVRYTCTVGADLLVVGTHGRTGIGRLLLGSVAEACVSRAVCPVLTVPSDATVLAPSAGAPILVPVTLGDPADGLLDVASAVAVQTSAPVELVHVVREAGPYPDLVPDYFSVADNDPEEATRVRERLLQIGASVRPREVHALMGDPSRVIPRLAASIRAGLVVMGTHGRRGIGRMVLGSVAEATLRRAPCPVLTLKAADLQPVTARPAVRFPALP